jgi:RNA polymerase sigma-70 factor (ECF subfamily)
MAGGEDAELMLAYARGNMRAFEALYARHKGPLYRYLQRLCGDRELANDLFQETWGKVVQARGRYEARAKFATYLFALARNCWIDAHRRASVRPIAADSAPAAADDADAQSPVDSIAAPAHESPERLLMQQQVRERYRQALGELPQEQRDVFLLYEESGLTLEEIATVTGVGAETAKSRLRYALAKLRAALAPLATVEAGEA